MQIEVGVEMDMQIDMDLEIGTRPSARDQGTRSTPSPERSHNPPVRSDNYHDFGHGCSYYYYSYCQLHRHRQETSGATRIGQIEWPLETYLRQEN